MDIDLIKIDRPKIHEIIFEKLKNAILDGEIKPGEKLLQDELAKIFGTSRMPVRDALRLLEANKLVDNLPNKGFTVVEFEEEELEDTLFLRSIMEREAVKLAKGKLTSTNLQELDEIIQEMDLALQSNNLQVMPKLNSKFHFCIYNVILSKSLLGLIKDLWNRFPRYAMLTSIESAMNSQIDHRRIVEAIRKDDYILASQIMEEHIKATHLPSKVEDIVG